MSSIAIVKPDHIGDLVLSIPAIRWLSSVSKNAATLYVAPSNLLLAEHLLPELSVRPLSFPHLRKQYRTETKLPRDELKQLRNHDMTVFLRQDSVINRGNLGHLVGECVFSETYKDTHEANNHRVSLRPYFGDHNPGDYWPGKRKVFPQNPRSVGLCIGSGFPTNKWSVVRWAELGRRLKDNGIEVTIIGGPEERNEAQILGEVLRLPKAQVCIGGADIRAFLNVVAELDLVVASDGGAGHLCSLVVPVLCIAASVPFRRFAPFGKGCRVLTLDLPCSPCLNAHETHLNLCFSHECSYGLMEADVLEAMALPSSKPGSSVAVGKRAKLFFGISHVGLADV